MSHSKTKTTKFILINKNKIDNYISKVFELILHYLSQWVNNICEYLEHIISSHNIHNYGFPTNVTL